MADALEMAKEENEEGKAQEKGKKSCSHLNIGFLT